MGNRTPDDTEPRDWVDDALDDRLRDEFARSLGGNSQPGVVLKGLGPAFGRARRRHNAKQAVLGVAACAMLIGGVGFALDSVENRSDDSATVAGEPEIEVADDPPAPLEVDGTTTVPRSPDPEVTDDDEGASGESETTGDAGSDENQPDTSVGSDGSDGGPSSTIAAPTTNGTSSGSPTTTAPGLVSTTIPTATTEGNPTTTLLESACGSVGVAVTNSTVTLVEIFPADGYRADEKSSGPTSIEVSFEGGGEHCELKAEMRQGRLEIEEE